jgi:hypothetical protein
MTHLLRYGLVLSALALPAEPAAAQWAPWCFFEMGNRGSGGSSCTFHSFAQCEATRIGIGGYCTPNPYLAYGAPRPGEGRAQRRNWRR